MKLTVIDASSNKTKIIWNFIAWYRSIELVIYEVQNYIEIQSNNTDHIHVPRHLVNYMK